jgi:quercetin dioxygenase-like cupin family protein
MDSVVIRNSGNITRQGTPGSWMKKRPRWSGILIKVMVNRNIEQEKSKSFMAIEIIEYVPKSVVIKSIIKKTTGNVSAYSVDSGETISNSMSAFDTYVQIIEGHAEVNIAGVVSKLKKGESIIIPAHTVNKITANKRFKMISTTIKSGFEEMVL